MGYEREVGIGLEGVIVIDDVLYMQTRIFRMFCERSGMRPRDANALFLRVGAWDFIADCFGLLHVSGDELVYDDVMQLLRCKGAVA